jgi:DNA-binding NarL/FixJ family response regulator
MRLLIVDDHRAVAEALGVALTPEFEVTGLLYDGREVLAWLDTHHIDVILLDATLPHCSIFDVIRGIRQHHPDTIVVIMSSYPSANDWPAFHRFGAHAAVSKADGLAEFARVLVDVAARKRPLADATIGDGRSVATPRQLDVLHALARGRSRKQIATDLGLSQFRVDEHVAELKHRFHAHTSADLVLRAVEEGILEPSVPPKPDPT